LSASAISAAPTRAAFIFAGRLRKSMSAHVKMLWGGRRRQGIFGALKQTDGAPHVASF
jgi:hypothetical protein